MAEMWTWFVHLLDGLRQPSTMDLTRLSITVGVALFAAFFSDMARSVHFRHATGAERYIAFASDLALAAFGTSAALVAEAMFIRPQFLQLQTNQSILWLFVPLGWSASAILQCALLTARIRDHDRSSTLTFYFRTGAVVVLALVVMFGAALLDAEHH